MMYETILSPINYGGMQLKNRIIFAPTTFGLSDEEYLAKIRAIAQGGCAMIIVGDVPVGKSKFEKSLFDPKGFAFYQQVVKIAMMRIAKSVPSCTRAIPTCWPCSSTFPASC